MNKDKLIADTKKRIEEINFKLKEIQNDMDSHRGESIPAQEESTLKHLYTLRDELRTQYERLSSSPKDTGQSDYDKMEKNIYNSLQSFDDAFTKAGSIFTRRFKRPK